MKNIITIALLFTLVINTLPAQAITDIKVQQGSVLNLNDCIAIALNNNPAIKNARYNYGISKSSVGLARSEYFPTIGVGTGYNINDTSGRRTTYNLSLIHI